MSAYDPKRTLALATSHRGFQGSVGSSYLHPQNCRKDYADEPCEQGDNQMPPSNEGYCLRAHDAEVKTIPAPPVHGREQPTQHTVSSTPSALPSRFHT